MARAAGRSIETSFVTRGGATLEDLYTSTNALEVLRGSRWDLVVLQEHSTFGLSTFNGDFVINEPTAFFTWARIWDGEIRSRGAHTVFMNTWARKGRAEQQPHVDWAYAAIAHELGAGLIPAGPAFQSATGIELYEPDGTHPSVAGSYLAACAAVEILAATGCAGASAEIPGVPMDNPTARLRDQRGIIVQLPQETAVTLQSAAMSAVIGLRSQSGYWRLPRPAFAGDKPAVAGTAPAKWAGRWEGTTWLYGQQANVVLQLNSDGPACSGTWSVTALAALTQATMPLQSCTIGLEGLRFVVRPLFFNTEVHEAAADGTKLQGRVSIITMTPNVRRTGTWTLQRTGQ